MSKLPLELCKTFFTNITLFESNGRFKLCGTNDSGDRYRVLSLELDDFSGPTLSEHPEPLDSRSLRRLLAQDSGSDSFQVRIRAVAFLGLVCLLDDDWHMHFVTERTAVGKIGGHTIYRVCAATLLPMKGLPETAVSPLLQKYRSLYNSVDITKDFYYSDSFDLTRTIQNNSTKTNSTINSLYCWNFAHLQNALKIKCPVYWLTPIIHGFFEQEVIELPEENRFLTTMLLCRRSRMMAGTRYQRRGLSPSARGEVANEVQSEIFVVAAKEWTSNTLYAGMVLHRGSIPLFWGHDQDRVSQPKPDIIFTKNDPEFAVTEIHFKRMLGDYSAPIVCLNLIRQGTHKECSIGFKYDLALQSLAVNKRFRENDIASLKYDFLSEQKAGKNIIEAIQTLIDVYFLKIGFLLHSYVTKSSDQPRRIQQGVFRVNCIDCLDRTNFAQYCIAQKGFALFLEGLGLEDAAGWENAYPRVSSTLKELFLHHGDRIANQYAGSGAMHKHAFSAAPAEESLEQDEQEPEVENKLIIDQVRGKVLSTIGKLKTNAANNNAITAIKRYYSNAITDRAKNQAIQLFLGHFRPSRIAIPIWDLPADSVFEEELSGDIFNEIPFTYPWFEQAAEIRKKSNLVSRNLADDLIDLSFVNGNSA